MAAKTLKIQWLARKVLIYQGFFVFKRFCFFAVLSQLCSICSYKNSITKDLTIGKWTCPECGSIHDRDINVAKNILSKGIEILTKDGTHPDSLFMLGSLESSSKKPPLL